MDVESIKAFRKESGWSTDAEIDYLIAEAERLNDLIYGEDGLDARLTAADAGWSEWQNKAHELQTALTNAKRDGETNFICFMIDNYERSEVTEEMLQRAYADYLKAEGVVKK